VTQPEGEVSLPIELSPDEIALLKEPQMAHVATVMPDGSPQVTPMWVDTDGESVIVNTVVGHVKHKNMLRDPRVAVSVTDRNNPFRALILRGVAELVEEGAEDHIDMLSQKYLGIASYPNRRPGYPRIMARITITSKFDLSAALSQQEWDRLPESK
jgi:PPOX class probable F420-dependent enzyme